MSRLVPDQFHDSHRLPFRVEIQLAPEGPFAVIIDADHRDVSIAGTGFDDMLRYVDAANARCTHTGKYRGITQTVSGPSLSTPERLSDFHPCHRMPSIVSTAFECLAVGVFRHWITPAIIADLRHWGVCDADGNPKPSLVERWLEWRQREDAELIRQGIHKAPTAVIQQFRVASRSRLTVVQ